MLLIVAIVLLLVLAWYQGGEQPMRMIEEDVSVPEGVL